MYGPYSLSPIISVVLVLGVGTKEEHSDLRIPIC